jgi:hypothetical protein
MPAAPDTKPGRKQMSSDFYIARLVLGEQQGSGNVLSAPRSILTGMANFVILDIFPTGYFPRGWRQPNR